MILKNGMISTVHILSGMLIIQLKGEKGKKSRRIKPRGLVVNRIMEEKGNNDACKKERWRLYIGTRK